MSCLLVKKIKTIHKVKIKQVKYETKKRNGCGTPIQPAGTELLNLGDRLSVSNHRLVWRSLRVRTKMSVKTSRLATATCTSGLEVNH